MADFYKMDTKEQDDLTGINLDLVCRIQKSERHYQYARSSRRLRSCVRTPRFSLIKKLLFKTPIKFKRRFLYKTSAKISFYNHSNVLILAVNYNTNQSMLNDWHLLTKHIKKHHNYIGIFSEKR